jgi:cytidine deaminase
MKFNVIKKSDLSEVENKLLAAALSVMKNAYNVYSGFYVGAAVHTSKGNIYSGSNMENASSGLSICAEPAAIQAANSAGEYDIRTIAIVGGGKMDGQRNEVVTPCGRCRQIIYESSQVAGHDTEVILCNNDLSKIVKTSIKDLLPMPFGPNDLGLEDEVKKFKNK